MKKLILVRHGEYGKDDRLNEVGRRQIRLLTEKLKLIVGGDSVQILSSTAQRALDSAYILGQAFLVGYSHQDVLWSDNAHRYNLQAALEVVRAWQDQADVLVLITHLEYVREFPTYFAREEWDVDIPYRTIDKGEGWILDCEEQTCELL